MKNRAFIKVQYSTWPWENRNWICAVLTINIFVRHHGDKLAELPAKFQSSVDYLDFNTPGLETHMVLFWDVFVNSLWLVDATKACNLVSIGGLFPDGAKALPEPSSMRYLSSTVTIELNVIRTLHDCPSQMNENLLISNSKFTSDSELIWWR